MTARDIPDDRFPPAEADVAQLRIPPNSVEAESSVLGGLLLDNAAWDRVGDLLTDADFYRYEHRLVYAAIGALINANKPADVVSVYVHLQGIGKQDKVGGLSYLNALAQYVPSAGNIRRYAEIVRERSILRQLVSASDAIATAAFNPAGLTVDAVLEQAQQCVFAIAEDRGAVRDEWDSPDDSMVQFLEGVQTRAEGKTDFLPLGIADLDERLDGGGRPGEVIVIAARPGMGKTALALSIGEHAAEKHGAIVGVLSMEMPKAQVHMRRVSMHSRVPLHKLKRPERMSEFDWSEMARGVDAVRRLPVYVSDQTALTINQLRTKARALKRRKGLRLLIVDYIGLMEGTDRKANRATQLGEVSRGIKALAKELGITVLLLAQLNREVEKRPNMRPIMADLRECGDIEQDADVILFVHRPVQVKPDLGPEWKHYAEIIVGKQRDGVTGLVHAQYVGECVTFTGWPDGMEIPTSPVRVSGGSNL